MNSAFFAEFGAAHTECDGYRLAKTLDPDVSDDKLKAIWKSYNFHDVKQSLKRNIQHSTTGLHSLPHEQVQGWVEVYQAFWKAAGELVAARGLSGGSTKLPWSKTYEAWKDLVHALIREYQTNHFEAWTIPCLYVTGKHLRLFAIRADEERNSSPADNDVSATFGDDIDLESEQNQKLEDCARVLNKVFNVCLSDRSPLEDSRKWGIYNAINLLFKTYFKLNSATLSKNILKALTAGRGDMPELAQFPKSQQVTFKYYEGVLCFLEENYVEAEKHLTEAWNSCHKDAMRNKELILTYLVPCHLLTTHTLPTERLLEPFPRLQKLFLPLCRCIKRGELHSFDLALEEGWDEFVKRRIYLTLERGRDIALRNLLRKVFLAGGFVEGKDGEKVRRTRIPIAEFTAAISLGSQEKVDSEEVECLLANIIYKGLMKGYISRDHGMVVLSKTGAFPGTGV